MRLAAAPRKFPATPPPSRITEIRATRWDRDWYQRRDHGTPLEASVSPAPAPSFRPSAPLLCVSPPPSSSPLSSVALLCVSPHPISCLCQALPPQPHHFVPGHDPRVLGLRSAFTDDRLGAGGWSELCGTPSPQLVLSDKPWGVLEGRLQGPRELCPFISVPQGLCKYPIKRQRNQPMTAQVDDSIATHPKRCLILREHRRLSK